MTTEAPEEALAGYRVNPETGAFTSLPWPEDREQRGQIIRMSLGPGVIEWAEGRTDEPGLIHHLTGEPWRFTPGQKRFLILWYWLSPEGRYHYRSGIKRGAKGTGKDPFAAAMLNAELIGPTWFTGFDEDGRPIGERHHLPLVQVMSNSEDQSKDVLRVANAMWSRDAREYYGLDCGETRTLIKSGFGIGGRLEVPPSSEASAEGDPATFIAINEALALDTPIPTPSGWTTMGELNVGDQVFGADGRPARVVKATEVYESRVCYRVKFQDGDSIVADAGHLWEARPVMIKESRVVTTEDLAGMRVRLPVTSPVELPEVDLPMDPYVLGAWLGDGSRNSLALTTSADDMPWWMSEFPRLGVPVRHRRSSLTGEEITIAGALHNGTRGQGYRAVLVSLDIYEHKRIPEPYLRGSIGQRLSLLQGLVDTDGCVTKDGRVIFVNANRNLADGVVELARSLGHVVHVSVKEDSRKATYQPMWRVEWMGDPDFPSARMPRKASRIRKRSFTNRWMTVTSVEQVSSVPVRCIAVDNEDHLFLAGQWKVTHNSHHMTQSSGGTRVYSVALRNVGKSPEYMQARAVEFTNAHQQGNESAAEKSFESFQNQQRSNYKGRRDILYDSIEADPALKITEPDQLRRAIAQAYMDAPWTDLERKFDEIMDTRTSVADSIRYYLNGLAMAEDAWIDPQAFDTLSHPEISVSDGDQIALFLDCSKSGDATGLVGCRLSDGFVFVVDVWQAPRGPRGKGWLAPRSEVDAKVRETFDRYRVVWFGVDPSPATDDDSVDEALYWAPIIEGWHRDFAKRLALWATPGAKGSSVLFDMRMSQPGAVDRNRLFTEMAGRVARDIDEDASLIHDGSSALRVHTHNARRRSNQWGVSLGKVTRDSGKLVDLAVCMVGARLGRKIALDSGKVRRKTGARKVVVLS